jgi:4-hydroxy-tetrahydrodipicolinate reductase
MNIAICGLGRAGKVSAKKIISDGKHKLVMGMCRDSSEQSGMDIGTILDMPHMGIPAYPLSDSTQKLNRLNVDVVIDFSGKETSLRLVEICGQTNTNLVICTTNFTSEETQYFRDKTSTGDWGLIYAPNLTLGINLLMKYVAKISRLLTDFDFTIVERHRKEKTQPTTTAKLISRAINREETPISSVRAGGYVGIHEVTAASEEERLTIVHESFSREAFAKGALLAAEYIKDKTGYFEMSDVIEYLEGNISK